MEQATRVGAPMLVGGLCSQPQQAGCEQGLGEPDTVAFRDILRQLAGLPKRV